MGVAYRPTQSKGSFHQLLMIMGSKSLYLLLFLTIFAPCLVLANPWSHSSSSSSYIHSNDTFTLELAENQDLHGAPGSFHRLKFLLKNNEYRRTYFIVNQETEDGFQGRIDDNEFSVGSSDQHTINVDLTVPQAKEGLKLIYTLTARKEDRNYRRKREEDPNRPGPGPVGGSSGYPGGSSNNNPGGSSNYNPGGSSNYNPGGSSNYPGGGGQNNPGGSNFNPGGGGWNNVPQYHDPSHKIEASVVLQFTITEPGDDFEDDTGPWTKVEYGADSDDQTCTEGRQPGDPNCNDELWWAKFKIQDSKSGLHSVEVVPDGKETYNVQVYYKYMNFHIGTTAEKEVFAAASCCVDSMKLKVQDVGGKTSYAHAFWDGTNSGLSKTALYAIIGASAGVVLIILIVVIVCVCKNKYSEVSQNP